MTNATEKTTRRLLLCGVLTPPLLVIFVIAAGLVTPDYSYVSQGISQLGAQGKPHPEVMNAGFIVSGLMILVFAYGLYQQLGRSAGARAVWILLAIASVCIVLSGVFQADLNAPGIASTGEGDLHKIFAGAAHFAFLAAMIAFAIVVRRETAWRGFPRISFTVVVLSLVVLLVFVAEVSKPIEGALQLSFLCMSFIWLEAVSLHSLRLPTTDISASKARGAEAELADSCAG